MGLILYLLNDLTKTIKFNQGQTVSPETLEKSKLETKFLLKYKLSDSGQSLEPFMINSFLQIGIEDPFPDDDKMYEGSLDDVDPDVYRIPDSCHQPVYGVSRYVP